MDFWKEYKNPLLYIILIFIAGVILYYPILKNDFVYDDYPIIVENPAMQTNTNLLYFFSHPGAFYNYPNANINYRPVGNWILSLEFSYFQFEPGYYHALSIILHALNAIILFFLFKYLFENKTAFAFLGSLIFLIHPVQTEAVALADLHPLLWMTFFGFLTIFLILKKERIPPRIYYLYIPLAFLSVFTKDQFVILPILVTAMLWLSGNKLKKYFKEIALISVIILLYIILRAKFVESFTQIQEFWGGGIWPTFLTMSNVFVKYLSLIIKGAPLTISYDDLSTTASLNLTTLFSILLLASFISALFFFVKKAPLISLGLAWFFITLLTVANFPFPLNSLMNERFLYPALPGIIIVFLHILLFLHEKIAKKKPPQIFSTHYITSAMIIFLVLLLGYYGITTKKRLYDWQDEETLWKSALMLSPHIRNWINYTRALQINGKLEEALKEYLFAKKTYGNYDYIKDMKNSQDQNQPPLVPEEFENAHAIRLAKLYARMEKFNEAETVLENRLRPIKGRMNRTIAIALGKIYLESKNYEEAMKIFSILEKDKEAEDEILFNYALLIYLKTKKLSDAEEIRNRIKNTNLRKILPVILTAYKEKEEKNWKNVSSLLMPALITHPIPVPLKPYYWLAEAETKLGNIENAFQIYRKILWLSPSSIDARRAIKELAFHKQ